MTEDTDIPSEPLTRIVCAAIRHKPSGLVIAGARHYDGIMRAAIHSMNESVEQARSDGWYSCEEGFITNIRGEFLTREQAWVVAEAAGQIRNRKVSTPGVLYSESLY